MNTIEEILRSKNIFEYYAEKLCVTCNKEEECFNEKRRLNGEGTN